MINIVSRETLFTDISRFFNKNPYFKPYFIQKDTIKETKNSVFYTHIPKVIPSFVEK